MADRRPFHETIVDQIRDDTLDAYDLEPLARLIKTTKIPKNHDAIIAIWKKRIERVDDNDGLLASALTDLEEQKSEAEVEARRKHEAELRQIVADAREDCN